MASCAVVLKSYMWNDFISRQLNRLLSGSGTLDVYLSIDETAGSAGPVPYDKVLRTNQGEMLELGLADRYEKGSLLWWNADYTHYQVLNVIPDYDYYLFVEYDACILGSIAEFANAAILSGVETVFHPRDDLDGWWWTRFHKNLYSSEEFRGALNCVLMHSNRALRYLWQRRREMSRRTDIDFWPLSETFVPTELHRGGFATAPLSRFGDLSRYHWFPPILEDDLDMLGVQEPAFVHPVRDKAGYIASLLANTHAVKDYFLPGSPMRQALARFPGEVTRGRLYRAALARGRTALRERLGAP